MINLSRSRAISLVVGVCVAFIVGIVGTTSYDGPQSYMLIRGVGAGADGALSQLNQVFRWYFATMGAGYSSWVWTGFAMLACSARLALSAAYVSQGVTSATESITDDHFMAESQFLVWRIVFFSVSIGFAQVLLPWLLFSSRVFAMKRRLRTSRQALQRAIAVSSSMVETLKID